MNRGQAALVLRVVLDVAALIGVAVGGYLLADGVLGVVFAVTFPTTAAVLWAVLRVPGDPGEAIVPVPGIVRFLLEIGLLAGAVALLIFVDRPFYGGIVAAITIAQYAAGFDRVVWLLTPSQSGNVRDPRA